MPADATAISIGLAITGVGSITMDAYELVENGCVELHTQVCNHGGMGDARVALRTIAVKAQCREDWSRMVGDDAVRHCGVCKSNVFNLSAMSEQDVEALLAHGQDLCVRYYSRPDGTLVRTKCEDSKAKRAPSTVAAGVAVTLATSTAFVGLDLATDRGSHEVAGVAEGPVLVAMGGLKLTIKPRKRTTPVTEPTPEAPISDAGRLSLSAAEPVECSDPWGCTPGTIEERADAGATTALATASVSRSPWRGIVVGALALLVALVAFVTRRRWSVGEPR